MSAKHTPGPWSWNLVRVQRAITDAQGGPVAYVHGEGVSEAESEANASLISASPDMLAVLLKLRRGDLHQRVRPLYDEAIAAIAKATGATA